MMSTTVQDYNGGPGEIITRDHEIRYFAIDNRLYPVAGSIVQNTVVEAQPVFSVLLQFCLVKISRLSWVRFT